MQARNVLVDLPGLFFQECTSAYQVTLCYFGCRCGAVSATLFCQKNRLLLPADTRYEQVYKRALSVAILDTEFFPGQATLKRSILIAGSTYTDDEKVLLKASEILREDARLRRVPHLILVPHEPTPERIAEIQIELNKRKLTFRCLSELESDANLEFLDVLIVDAVGILAKLYQLADIAFVGGSFHGSVHNVMEPAAMAKPVLFGPTIQNSYEASLLLERGAAKIAHTPQQMADILIEWLHDEEERTEVGNVGKQLIAENLGAVERTLAYLRKYV